MKSRPEKNAIGMYSTHNEGKFAVAERFIRTLENKNYKYMTSISKYAFIDKLDDIVNKYNNTYVRISKYRNVFTKVYVPNWSEEVLVTKNVKNTVPWTYAISGLNEEKTVGTFYEKELQKSNQKEFRVEKVIKRKGDKLYVK